VAFETTWQNFDIRFLYCVKISHLHLIHVFTSNTHYTQMYTIMHLFVRCSILSEFSTEIEN